MASEQDVQDVIKTLIAEGVGEGEEGMRRIAETILNRAAERGISPAEVVRQRAQYTGYSNPGPAAVRAFSDPSAQSAAQAAWQMAQGPDDPTNGANHYWNPNVVNPSWAGSMTQLGQFGNHAFATDRAAPRAVAPTPATQSPLMASSRAVTSPSGGDTGLQASLNAYATRQGNQVVPLMRSSGANPALADAARRAALSIGSNQTYAGQSGYKASAFNGDPLTPSNGRVIASIPTGRDPLTPSNGPVIATIPTTGPTTRSVQSVPMPPLSTVAANPPARPISPTPARTVPLTTGVQQSYAGQDRATPVRTTQLPTAAQLQAATGLRVPAPVYQPAAPAKTQERLASVYPIEATSVGMSRVPLFGANQSYAGQDRAIPAIKPVGAAAFAPPARPVSMTPAPIAARTAPVPLSRPAMAQAPIMASTRPVAPVARPLAAPIMAASAPLSVVVQANRPAPVVIPSAVQNSPEWQRVTGTEPRYTTDSNGTKTDASGGKYYSRNY